MLNIFKKYFKKDIPEFLALTEYEFKGKYFYRVASWMWLNERQIVVHDPHGPRMITMYEWPQIIFLDAKGKLTVTEYVDYMAEQYSKVPKGLDNTIIEQLNSLFELKLIDFSDTEVTLEDNIIHPVQMK